MFWCKGEAGNLSATGGNWWKCLILDWFSTESGFTEELWPCAQSGPAAWMMITWNRRFWCAGLGPAAGSDGPFGSVRAAEPSLSPAALWLAHASVPPEEITPFIVNGAACRRFPGWLSPACRGGGPPGDTWSTAGTSGHRSAPHSSISDQWRWARRGAARPGPGGVEAAGSGPEVGVRSQGGSWLIRHVGSCRPLLLLEEQNLQQNCEVPMQVLTHMEVPIWDQILRIKTSKSWRLSAGSSLFTRNQQRDSFPFSLRSDCQSRQRGGPTNLGLSAAPSRGGARKQAAWGLRPPRH